METIFHRIFENHISKSTSSHRGVILGALGGEEQLKSKIGLKYVLSATDSITLFFENSFGKPNRVEIIHVENDEYKVIFRTVENYVYYVHSVFARVCLKDFLSLFEKETELDLPTR